MKVVFRKKGLERIMAQLGSAEAKQKVQVGLFAGKGRTGRSRHLTNAQIGYAHETENGSISAGVPQRSFLKMPLEQHLQDDLKFDWTKSVMSKGGITSALKKLGVIAEGTIQKAFATGGFGQWAPLSPRTVKRKRSSAILIETSQMRRAITSRVV